MKNKDAILEELRRSRLAIARDTNAISDQLNMSAKIQRSVKRHPLAWIGGAAALGYIFAGPKTKTITKIVPAQSVPDKKNPPPVEKKNTSHFLESFLRFFKVIFPLVRPVLMSYATRRMGEFAEKIGR